MYFWNSDALSDDLKEKTVSQREKLKYLLVYMGLTGLIMQIAPGLGEKTPTAVLIAEGIICLAITLGGIIFCYQANRQGDDEEF